MPMSASRAWPSSGKGLPITSSARSSSASSASAPSGRKTSTRARDSKAALSSNDGFSVVAPISVIEPSSITGRKESCCARLKRWISSTNSSVPCPSARRARAASKIFFSSATPVWIAETCTNASLRDAADQPRDRRLAAARRPPEDHRAERRRREQARQRAVRAGQMLLARHLGERHRPQPLGERRRRRLRLGIEAVEKAHRALSRARDPLSSRLRAACRAARAAGPLSASSHRTEEPAHEFLRPALRSVRDAGIYSGTARRGSARS